VFATRVIVANTNCNMSGIASAVHAGGVEYPWRISTAFYGDGQRRRMRDGCEQPIALQTAGGVRPPIMG
jgi:hypothetical protein